MARNHNSARNANRAARATALDRLTAELAKAVDPALIAKLGDAITKLLPKPRRAKVKADPVQQQPVSDSAMNDPDDAVEDPLWAQVVDASAVEYLKRCRLQWKAGRTFTEAESDAQFVEIAAILSKRFGIEVTP
jgi:hypothetical protein